ncbi:MAG: hypothetical protein IT552_02535 [Sphingomonadaceae bacterium]|nr:hypothetical protein [Sphingomonadaceae bacterium]
MKINDLPPFNDGQDVDHLAVVQGVGTKRASGHQFVARYRIRAIDSVGVAIGYATLGAYGGGEAVAIGDYALFGNLSAGIRNIGIGGYAGAAIATGSYNIFLGYGAGAGAQPVDVSNAIGIGKNVVVPASNTVVIGDADIADFRMFGTSLAKGKAAQYAYFFGNAGNITHTSNAIVAMGEEAMLGLVSGDQNIGIGHHALRNAATPGNVVAIGAYALREADSVIDSVAVGNEALKVATAGLGLVAVGHWSLRSSTTGTGNTGVGDSTLHDLTDGNENVAIGYTTSHNNISGDGNTEVGYAAGRTKTNGDYNVNIGYKAGFSATAGHRNVNVGYLAGDVYSGSDAVAVGAFALSGATGAENTGLGYGAGGSITTGSRNLFLGFASGQHGNQKVDAVNSTAIGPNTYTTKNNQVVFGDVNVIEFKFGDVTVPKAAMMPYLITTIRPGDATIDVNSVNYIPVQSLVTSLDFDRFPATHFRLVARGYATENGQTVTMQLDEVETGAGAPVSAAGNDLTVTNNGGNYAFFKSGWIPVDGAMAGMKHFFVRLKGSNGTVDILLRHLQIEWKIEP